MKRYTFKSLVAECSLMNDQMKDAGIDWTLVPARRYEWSAVDIRNSHNQDGSIHSNLECGLPRECAAAARLFVAQQFAKQKEQSQPTILLTNTQSAQTPSCQRPTWHEPT